MANIQQANLPAVFWKNVMVKRKARPHIIQKTASLSVLYSLSTALECLLDSSAYLPSGMWTHRPLDSEVGLSNQHANMGHLVVYVHELHLSWKKGMWQEENWLKSEGRHLRDMDNGCQPSDHIKTQDRSRSKPSGPSSLSHRLIDHFWSVPGFNFPSMS